VDPDKKSRAAGVVAVSVGLLIATVVMLWTDADLRFGHVQPSEPGDRGPAAPSPSERGSRPAP
jgi:hypothetical protein